MSARPRFVRREQKWWGCKDKGTTELEMGGDPDLIECFLCMCRISSLQVHEVRVMGSNTDRNFVVACEDVKRNGFVGRRSGIVLVETVLRRGCSRRGEGKKGKKSPCSWAALALQGVENPPSMDVDHQGFLVQSKHPDRLAATGLLSIVKKRRMQRRNTQAMRCVTYGAQLIPCFLFLFFSFFFLSFFSLILAFVFLPPLQGNTCYSFSGTGDETTMLNRGLRAGRKIPARRVKTHTHSMVLFSSKCQKRTNWPRRHV